jgi:hypothetical protein
LFWQQPLGHDCALHPACATHAWFVQTSFVEEQFVQLPPPFPHAAGLVPATQTLLLQQPPEQFEAPHT